MHYKTLDLGVLQIVDASIFLGFHLAALKILPGALSSPKGNKIHQAVWPPELVVRGRLCKSATPCKDLFYIMFTGQLGFGGATKRGRQHLFGISSGSPQNTTWGSQQPQGQQDPSSRLASRACGTQTFVQKCNAL